MTMTLDLPVIELSALLPGSTTEQLSRAASGVARASAEFGVFWVCPKGIPSSERSERASSDSDGVASEGVLSPTPSEFNVDSPGRRPLKRPLGTQSLGLPISESWNSDLVSQLSRDAEEQKENPNFSLKPSDSALCAFLSQIAELLLRAFGQALFGDADALSNWRGSPSSQEARIFSLPADEESDEAFNAAFSENANHLFRLRVVDDRLGTLFLKRPNELDPEIASHLFGGEQKQKGDDLLGFDFLLESVRQRGCMRRIVPRWGEGRILVSVGDFLARVASYGKFQVPQMVFEKGILEGGILEEARVREKKKLMGILEDARLRILREREDRQEELREIFSEFRNPELAARLGIDLKTLFNNVDKKEGRSRDIMLTDLPESFFITKVESSDDKGNSELFSTEARVVPQTAILFDYTPNPDASLSNVLLGSAASPVTGLDALENLISGARTCSRHFFSTREKRDTMASFDELKSVTYRDFSQRK